MSPDPVLLAVENVERDLGIEGAGDLAARVSGIGRVARATIEDRGRLYAENMQRRQVTAPTVEPLVRLPDGARYLLRPSTVRAIFVDESGETMVKVVTVTSCDACPFLGYREEGAYGMHERAVRWCSRADGPALGPGTPGYEDGDGIPDACPLRAAPVRVEVAT